MALDPGLRVCGVALFDGGQLREAWLAKNPEKTERGPKAWLTMAEAVAWNGTPETLVLELPQIYTRSKGDPNDLIQIAGVLGAVAALTNAGEVRHYLPREWKGQLPKQVMCARAEAHLSDTERAAIRACPPGLRHNVLDAIGLGLFHLGRL